MQSLKSSALTHGKLLTKIVFFKNSQKWHQVLEVGLKIGPKIYVSYPFRPNNCPFHKLKTS